VKFHGTQIMHNAIILALPLAGHIFHGLMGVIESHPAAFY
jgi:hypothetical protein